MLDICSSRIIFWDFDGVIKDSISVKTNAFSSLFLKYGDEIVSRIQQHHEANGGVSRYEKIPLYLTWAEGCASPSQIELFCEKFSRLVMQAVIESPWVPGAREYLMRHYRDQYFVLLTATPQGEIEKILEALGLSICFRKVFGAPAKKDEAMKAVLTNLDHSSLQALMIGDSEGDLKAAEANGVPFFLRRTPLNVKLQLSFQGPIFDNFNNE
jgi:phosphoglycolate phosphatase-like HAD superfamily hydrolase